MNNVFKNIGLINNSLVTQQHIQEFAAIQDSLGRSMDNTLQPLIEWQQQQASLLNSQLNLVSQVQIGLMKDHIIQMQKLVSSAFLNPLTEMQMLSDSLAKQFVSDLQLSTEEFSSTVAANLAKSFSCILSESIVIHDNYVEMPEFLIPDDFSYEEIENSIRKKLEPAEKSKRLSFSDALVILIALIQMFCWIISSIQSEESSLQDQLNHDELISVQEKNNKLIEESNILKIEENNLLREQLAFIEKQTEYLIAIYKQNQESDSTLPNNDFSSPDTDLNSPDALLESPSAESIAPTESDDSSGTYTDVQSD